MGNLRRLFVTEWLAFRGKHQQWLAETAEIDKGLVSILCQNKFKRTPRPSTMEKLAKALNIRVEQLWMDPFAISERTPRYAPDFEDWLIDPLATYEGKPVDQSLREDIRQFLEMLTRRKP